MRPGAATGEPAGAPGPVSAAARAESVVAAARDDPAGRLRLAADFYRLRVAGRSIRSYRRAEVAFMRWQIKRGVLAAPDADRPGSPWWRAVNESLLRDTTEAALLYDGAPGSPSAAAVRHWVSFLRRPSPVGWYRAHNSSVVSGYLANRGLVAGESMLERFFMDVALLRVLYAHALLARPRLALGRLSVLGPVLGDPRHRAADLFLSLQNVLPDAYPLRSIAIDELLKQENQLARIFDYGVITPRVEPLYRCAAEDLGEPRLVELQDAGSPVYAWPARCRHVWQLDRPPRSIGVARAVVGPPPG